MTERKRADEALRNAEERYRVLFEQAPNGIVLIDAQTGRTIEANETACRKNGPPDRTISKPCIAPRTARSGLSMCGQERCCWVSDPRSIAFSRTSRRASRRSMR